MTTRRSFILMLLGVLLWPWRRFVRASEDRPGAKKGKRILPSDVDTRDLRSMNPKDIDARNVEVTPLDKFGTMGLTDHETDIAKWRLKVGGEVENPLELTYEQVRKQPSITSKELLICPGVFAGQGLWKGARLSAILDKAKAAPDATHVTFYGPPGPYEKVHRIPIEEARSDTALLAYEVNGQTLPQKHGFPLRLVAPNDLGFDWVKYVHRIKVDKIELGESKKS